MKFLYRIDTFFSSIEKFFLVFLLALMIFFKFTQVLLRNLFDTGLPWADPILTHLVLWVGLFGAAQAARMQKHINVDVLGRIFKDSQKKYLSLLINTFALIVTTVFIYASWVFVAEEKGFGTIITVLGVQTWVFQVLIPVGFVLIGYRFFLNICDSIIKIVKRTQ